ncbi:hypothetical protein QA089_001336 [Meyerozyma guilliermondii]
MGNFTVTRAQFKYITFTIIGVSLLWPWNCFLSASAYYGERFVGSPSLAKTYSSTMMTVSTITSLIYNYYLSQAQTGANYHRRVNLGLGITAAIFCLMAFSCVLEIFLAMNDTVFFFGLMTMVLVSAAATCLAQNGTMALVNVLGSIYANGVMVGQAIAGVLPSVALIASLLIVGETKTEGKRNVESNFGLFLYYITASLVSLVGMGLLYIVAKKGDNEYRALEDARDENGDHIGVGIGDGDVGGSGEYGEELDVGQSRHVPFHVLWSKLKYLVSTIVTTFAVTLVFPVFASNVQSVHEGSGWVFKKAIFVPFIYFVWNMGDVLGRILCGTPGSRLLIRNQKVLLLYSVLRIVYVPLFLTCNVHPEKGALFASDIWYIMLQFTFGLSNGQCCTSAFMVVGDHCDDDDEKEAAGGFTTVFLSFGLALGSVASYVVAMM